MRQRVDDHELGEPLDADAKRHASSTHTSRQRLRAEQPWYAVPAEAIEKRVDVDHRNRSSSSGVHGWRSVERARDLRIASEIEHSKPGTTSANEQQSTAPYTVDKYERVEHC